MSISSVELMTVPVEELKARLDRLTERAAIMLQLSEAKAITLPDDVWAAIQDHKNVLSIMLAVAKAAEVVPPVVH